MHPTDRLLLFDAPNERGLITFAAVAAHGVSRSAWHRRHREGLLVAVQPGVSRVASRPLTTAAAIDAAVLAAGAGAMAGHASAAFLWEALGADDVVVPDVIVPGRGRRPALRSARVHRPIDDLDLRPVRRGGIPTANPLRVLVDLGATADDGTVERVLARFLIDGRLGLDAARAVLDRHARRGRPGIGALRRVLDGWGLERPPDSILEPAVDGILRRAGLGGFVFHLDVGPYELDFGHPDLRIAIEVDGWDTHGSRRAFIADRERDGWLAERGWIVLRFVWHQVVREPDAIANRIAAVVARRSTTTRPRSRAG